MLGNLILPFSCCFETITQMLLPVAFSMLSKIIALFVAYLQMQLDIINRELKQGIDLTLARHLF
jgi:hypothetical protein